MRELTVEEQVLADGQLYGSGLLTTEMSFASQRGYIEIRADVPDEQGLWSSLWMLPADGDWSSEIDIAEVLGSQTDTVFTNVWNDQVPNSEAISGIDVGDGYHIYGLKWTEETIEWYIDGQLVRETPNTVDEEMYLALSLAVGGFGGEADETTDLSDGMSIDYVRVYELESDPNRNEAIEPGMFRSEDLHAGAEDSDVIYGSRWRDVIDGGTGDDIIHGRNGADILEGGDGMDEVYGNAGKDLLFGGAGDDKLIGGAGSDTLTGGAGTDHLWGDSFGGGKDYIHDFESQKDVIDLSSFGFDWNSVSNTMQDEGWATRIDLAQLSGQTGDVVYVVGVSKEGFHEDHFSLLVA